MSKIYPTFDDIHKMTLDIHRQLQNVDYDYIIAPSRGGLVPGVILSHLANKRLVPIVWSTRDHVHQDLPNDIKCDIYNGLKVVLIDDINDSGATFMGLMDASDYGPRSAGSLILTSLYQRYNTKFKSDYFSFELKNDSWVVFPWEQWG